ncbi:Cys-tRNA(Pro) deacylase [Corynebacterium epidermidicanis]|uniref:Cys-tRNA(Pro)/Cys-tRNA(Cys) deacylase n=1 Tax=Corynebacterium epidermidicanis TaxID=1050174 RepID=A0A0G3GUI8_9CORY|nr:Cys-tRNA(Pro) deacylase [Corynebacterium epidermidicanis]AKK02547.1 Cys-tRNA(Pro) deacylase [Corynebacterium epidermidicanis]
MAKKNSTGTAALQALVDAALPHTVHQFDTQSHHYGAEAAAELSTRLGIAAEQVFKTLLVDLSAGKGPKRQLAVCCIPVTEQLGLKKAATAHGASKATMADPKDAERSSGYVVGGISPIGQKHPLPTVIDETAQLFDVIFVSGGKRGLDIELSPDTLREVTGASFADLVAD